MAERIGLEERIRHLELVAKQVREQGDVQQVMLGEDGVSKTLSLADELWIIAYSLRLDLKEHDAKVATKTTGIRDENSELKTEVERWREAALLATAGEAKAESQLEGMVNQLEELLDGIPTYGPVDGTGRPDPDGEMMLDVSRDRFKAEVRSVVARVTGTASASRSRAVKHD